MRALDDLSLRTERLVLRAFRQPDAEALFAIFSDAKVMRYWSEPAWTSVEQAEAVIARDRMALTTGAHVGLAIELVDTAQLIGMCTLFGLVPKCKRGEVGYALSSTFWGCGYMHEALVALLEFGFTELGLNRVEADIDPRNEASARSLERLGFRKEGHLRERWIVEGEVSDSSLYGLLRRDWVARGGKAGER